MSDQTESGTSDTVTLDGVLTAREVAELERRYRGRFDGRRAPRVVNLAGVASGDSSALALLLEWQSRAGSEIRFDQPPESLRVIARLTGVDRLLGWAANDLGGESAKEP